MNKDKVKSIIALREYVIDCHDKLDGGNHPGTSIIKQADVAYYYSQIIKRIDGILSDHVSFE